MREHKLTLEVEERRKLRNEAEKETEVQIQQKNLEADIRSLEIARENEFARLRQQEEIAVERARQKADVVKEEAERYREAEQAQIKAQEDVKKTQIEQQRSIDIARLENEERTKAREIEKRKQIQLGEQERDLTILEKSKQVLNANLEEELARAKTVEAEEKVVSAREFETAERQKRVELIRAAQQAEREAIQLTTLAKAEKEASQEKEQADKHTSLAARLRYEVEAAGKQMLNEAENMRSDASRRSALRMQLAGNLDSIIREAVKPMQNIDAIKILEVNGLPGFSDGHPKRQGGVTAAGCPGMEKGPADPGAAWPTMSLIRRCATGRRCRLWTIFCRRSACRPARSATSAIYWVGLTKRFPIIVHLGTPVKKPGRGSKKE